MYSNIIYFSSFIYVIVLLTIKNLFFKGRISVKYFGKQISSNILFESIWFVVIFFPILIVYGMRYKVGIDYESYATIFSWLKHYKWSEIGLSYLEPGYVFLNILAGKIFSGEWAIFMLSGIVILGFLYMILCQYKKDISVQMAGFIFLMTFFAISCNAVRQCIAMMIVMYGYKYAIERNWKKYMLIVFIAISFHYSAIVCLIFYWFASDLCIKYDKIIKWMCVLSPFVVIIGGQAFINVLFKMGIYGGYISNIVSMDLNELKFICYLLPELLFVEIIKKEHLTKNRKLKFYILLLYFQIPFQTLGIYSSTLERVSLYVAIVRIITIPLLINLLSVKKKRRVYSIWVYIWYFIYFVVMNLYLNGNGIYPYKFIEI